MTIQRMRLAVAPPLFRKSVMSAAVAMALCVTLTAQATPSQSVSAKSPWLWSTDERIAKRTNPAEREARRARALKAGRYVAPNFTPIDGSIEPELFLPVELVTRVVLNTKPPNERTRELYRAAIVSHGWNYDEFWEVLHAAAAPYLSLMHQSGVLQRQAGGGADLSQLAPQICSASADLLDAAYKAFGEQAFSEFLYGRIAPPIRRSIADHADTVDALRKKQRGCR